ncbi:MAG: hypothetical protein IPK26_22820 [Planctomycetes bacterium]|nr:hypothetical protein [Planctomycetota bacterium]
MKLFLAIVASSALGFSVVFAYVPQRPPQIVPPNWFELPGVPIRVDGKPVWTWAEVNRAMRKAAQDYQNSQDFGDRLVGLRPELEGPGVRIEYVPTEHRRDGQRWQQVTVRPFFPKTADWSRAAPEDMVRYEIERPSAID